MVCLLFSLGVVLLCFESLPWYTFFVFSCSNSCFLCFELFYLWFLVFKLLFVWSFDFLMFQTSCFQLFLSGVSVFTSCFRSFPVFCPGTRSEVQVVFRRKKKYNASLLISKKKTRLFYCTVVSFLYQSFYALRV